MRKALLATVLCGILGTFSPMAAPQAEAAPVKVSIATTDTMDTFPFWYAIEKGWDKESGIQLDLKLFSSGMDQLNALAAGEWSFALQGGVPASFGALRFGTKVVYMTANEDVTNAIMVRPNSAILKTKGFNPEYPDVYGHPNDVKGKEFLCTTATSAHMALSSWLNVLGLKDSDVTIKNMDQAAAVTAFETNIGEAVSLWAPHMFKGIKKGWQIAADVKTCKQALPNVIIADPKFIKENPEITAKVLALYMRGVEVYNNAPEAELIPLLQRFNREYVGIKFSAEEIKMNVAVHSYIGHKEALDIFDDSKGASKIQKWQGHLANFFASVGRMTAEEAAKISDGKYATGEYIRLVKEVPAYK